MAEAQKSQASRKKTMLYIATPEQVSNFRLRAVDIDDEIKIGTIISFGSEPYAESFDKILTAAKSGTVEWVVFYLPEMGRTMGNKTFISEMKRLIKNGGSSKTKLVIIDKEGICSDSLVETFSKVGVSIIDDEAKMGSPIDKIKTQKQVDDEKYAEEFGAFAEVKKPKYQEIEEEKERQEAIEQAKIAIAGAAQGSGEGWEIVDGRLPGMKSDTPMQLDRMVSDPFAELEMSRANSGDDPFTTYDSKMEEATKKSDLDPFSSFDDRDIDVESYNDDPFASDNDTIQVASQIDPDDPFGDISSIPSRTKDNADNSDDPFGNVGTNDIDPFGEELEQNAGADPFSNDPFGDDDVYENFDDTAETENDLFSGLSSSIAPVLPNSSNDSFDPFNNYVPEPVYDEYGYGYAEVDDQYADEIEERLPDGTISLNYLLRKYGDEMNDNELAKLQSMIEPVWDYSLEHADNIGQSGGSGLFGRGKKNNISQVDQDMLANSTYIAYREAEDGYYSPPNDCKFIAVQGFKGGIGKTTLSVMLATQLNWFFNPQLMQRMSTAMTARVLILSVNEFDDIPTHGIGYDSPTSEESEYDGKNIAELLRRIDETSGEPGWDDISHCFVSTERNRVFYLPSLTSREMLSGNIDLTAEDYKQIFDVCSRFFQFVIIDCPDIFYQERNDLMTFVFSIADVICMVIEADARSTLNLFHFYDGLKSDVNKIPLDADKCMLAVNRYVEPGNPYLPCGMKDQQSYESICKTLAKYFCRFVAIPFTQPIAIGNILNGTDPKVKYAAAEFADSVLEIIDENDRKAERKRNR